MNDFPPNWHAISGEGELLGLSNHQIACFAVEEHPFCVAVLPLCEVMLPRIVGRFAEGNVSFQVQPAASKGQNPIFGQR